MIGILFHKHSLLHISPQRLNFLNTTYYVSLPHRPNTASPPWEADGYILMSSTATSNITVALLSLS